MAVSVQGAGTMWEQKLAADNAQMADNDHLWEIIFGSGGTNTAVREIAFGGQAGFDPLALHGYLINKQGEADERAEGSPAADGLLPPDRCAFCRHQFGTKYEDQFFGTIEIRRNRRNRYYCNQCDYFIRVCPGEVTLVMPVLMVDVKDSRGIRTQVGDLRAYSRLLVRFQRRVAAEIQRNLGFVLNTIGDAVLAVWPAGFIPPAMRNGVDGGKDDLARIPAMCAVETAQALARIAPVEFDGQDLPFRGAVDTTEMVIFAVAPNDPKEAIAFDVLREDKAGDPMPGFEASEIPVGPAAVDVAGEAVEVASALASRHGAAAGQMYITRRTDEVAAIDPSALEYDPQGDTRIMARSCTRSTTPTRSAV
jgi:hypothetical protein